MQETNVPTIYLVKRDPRAPLSRGNWKIMNKGDFERFQMTGEGKRRAAAFAPLDPYGEYVPDIVAECGTVRAHQWQKEKEQYESVKKLRYFREAKSVRMRRRTVTMKRDTEVGMTPENPRLDVERYVIWRETLEILNRGLQQLSDEQREVLSGLYLQGPEITEDKLANELGLSRAAVDHRKRSALSEMRKYLILQGVTAAG